MKTTTTNARPAALAAAARNASTNAERRTAVLLRAHDMTRRTLAAFPGADYRVTLAAALRIAWADATAPTAAEAWTAMSPEEQLDALTRMTYRAAARDIAGCDKRGNERTDRFAWARVPSGAIASEHVAEIVNEAAAILPGYIDPAAVAAAARSAAAEHERRAAAIRATLDSISDRAELNRAITDALSADEAAKAARKEAKRAERHINDGTTEKPLAALMYQAAVTAAQAINRAERRNARAIKWADVVTGADDDGKETTERIARIVNNAAPAAERFLQPEAAAVLHDTISSLARDDTDRRILDGMIRKYSRRDIAEHIGISHTAVNKRVNRMIDRYAAAADPDELAADLVAYRIRRRLA